MKQSPHPDASAPGGDPWAAFGYIVAGVAFYGVIGWGLSVWLHADYWLPIGLLAGLALGMFLVFSRYRIGGSETIVRGDHKIPLSTSDSEVEGAHPDTADRDWGGQVDAGRGPVSTGPSDDDDLPRSTRDRMARDTRPGPDDRGAST